MSIEHELRRAGGVLPSSELLARGFSRYDVSRAIAEGAVMRPRNGWLAVRNADPQLVYAARHRVVLSCITQAARLGLWVLRHAEPHVAAHLTSKKAAAPGAVVHWRRPLVLRPPAMLADHLENVLDCVASCQPRDAALAIWDSALRKKLIDYPSLETLPFRGVARALLRECTPLADSGTETLFRTRLGWLRIPIRPQAWVLGHRVDFLIGDRLIVQIDGVQHGEEQQSQIDKRHDAALGERGYYVIRVTYAQVVHHWHEVEELVLKAIARGKHLPPRR